MKIFKIIEKPIIKKRNYVDFVDFKDSFLYNENKLGGESFLL